MGSVWGKNIKISVFGESHGEAVGVTIDGFPAGIHYDETFIHEFLERRKAKKKSYSTSRIESDMPKILSGIFDGKTQGTPICAIFENSNTKSHDYSNLLHHPRPSHADLTGNVRYNGFNDIRGGGHFSGRLTLPIAFAGALCQLFLQTINIDCFAHILNIGPIFDDAFDKLSPDKNGVCSKTESGLTLLNIDKEQEMMDYLEKVRLDQNSVGGVVECAVTGMPLGIGSPIFQSAESVISSLLFSIPAVKGVEFGSGFELSSMCGSDANDRLSSFSDGKAQYFSNNNGGIIGGITNGAPIIVKTAFKPTPSVSTAQNTFNVKNGEVEELVIHGRHDPCVVPRAVCVVESALALSITDLILEAYGYEFTYKHKK